MASRVIREVGSSLGGLNRQSGLTAANLMAIGGALTGVGATMGAIGAAGLAFFNDATNSAIDYRKQAALAMTQTDGVTTSIDELVSIGREVAREIPAAYDQMQPTLYDIFSSTNANIEQAQILLRGFAKESVAGNSDIQSSARSTMAIMNAFKIPYEDITRVSDMQFQTVRKGVITYDELQSVIGLVIPAANRAGQSIETMGAMMAFLTRNGLTASRSSTSAARALEAFAHPRVVSRLEEMGVQVRDMEGNYRPLVDVLGQINERTRSMPGPERAAFITELLKGAGGTIQARRFWDLALKNFEDFEQHVAWQMDNAGALEDAYSIMFEEPASKIQLMENRLQELKDTIGDELIPIKLRLAEAVATVLGWWNSLDEGTQRLIIRFGFFAATFMAVTGAVMVLVGTFLMLVATIAPLVGGIKMAMAIILGMNLAFLALIAAGVLIWQNWDTIKEYAKATWPVVKDYAQQAWDTIKNFASWLAGEAVGMWGALRDAALAVWPHIVAGAQSVWDFFVGLYDWFVGAFVPGFLEIWTAIREGVGGVLTEIVETGQWFWQTYGDTFRAGFELLLRSAEVGWALIQQVFIFATETIWPIIQTLIDLVVSAWQRFGDDLIAVIEIAWNFISTIIASAITIVTNIIQLGLNIIQGDWGEAWENIKNILGAAWNAIWATLQAAWALIRQFFTSFLPSIIGFIGDVIGAMFSIGWDLIQGIYNGVLGMWPSLSSWFGGFINLVITAIGNVASALYQVGRDLIQGAINGVGSMAGALARKVSEVMNVSGIDVAKNVLGISSPSTVFEGIGKDVIAGFVLGIERNGGEVLDVLRNLFDKAVGDVQEMVGAITSGRANHQAMLDLQEARKELAGIEAAMENPELFRQTRERQIGELVPGILRQRDVIQGLEDQLADAKFFREPPEAIMAIERSLREQSGILSEMEGRYNKLVDLRLPTTADLVEARDKLLDAEIKAMGAQSKLWQDQNDLIGLGAQAEADLIAIATSAGLAGDSIQQLLGWYRGFKTHVEASTGATRENIATILAQKQAAEDAADAVNKSKQKNPRLDLTDAGAAALAPYLSQGAPTTSIGLNIENAYFGDDNPVEELDWWARTQTAGV